MKVRAIYILPDGPETLEEGGSHIHLAVQQGTAENL